MRSINGCVKMGENVTIKPGVVLGEWGFGFHRQNEKREWKFKEHEFGLIVKDDVWIGANTVIDRGSWRDTHIGKNTKINNLVHIGHNVIIGENCLIGTHVIIAGSTVLEDNVIIWNGAKIANRCKIREGAIIGTGSVVLRKTEIPPRQVWVGNPAKFLRMRREKE